MDSVVISVRVRKDMKERLEQEGIDVEKSIRDFLAQKSAQIELRRTIKRLSRIIDKNVKPSKRGFSVKSVREDRHAAH